jgi:hypothetical protein
VSGAAGVARRITSGESQIDRCDQWPHSKNDCSRAAGVNDALAAEVIQVDVSLACYAGVEMVATIKRTCAQAATIRQTIEATTVA